MAIPIYKTTYETSPNTKIAAVDVYAPTVPVVPTNSEVVSPTVMDTLGLGKYKIDKTSELFSEATKVWQDPDKSLMDVFEEIKNVTKDSKSFKENLTSAILGDVLASSGYVGTGNDIAKVKIKGANTTSILNAIGAINPGIKAISGDIEKIISSNDLANATGVANMIGELSGNAELLKILNISPKMSLIKGVIDVAMSMGLGDAVDGMIKKSGGKNEQRQLRLFSCINAAMNSDLKFLTTAMDDKSIGVGAILALYPDILEIILSNYKVPTYPGTKEHCNELIKMAKRFDTRWLVYKRNGVDITSLRNFSMASDDAIDVLVLHDTTRVPAMLARTAVGTNMVIATLALRPFTPAKVLEF